jgi:hypothetical protein
VGLLDRFSPMQRQMLAYGGAAVGGLVVITKLSSRGKTSGTGGTAVPSTDALGTGQLMDFESKVTDQLAALAMLINQKPKPPTPAPVKPPVMIHDPSANPGPQVVHLQPTGVPGVYAAPVPGMPGVVVGQAPPGPFVYGGTQAQAQAVLDGGASSQPAHDLTFDDPFIWDKPWP